MHAIITAGGRIDGEFARQTGVTTKALLELEGKTLLQRVLEAVRASRRVERIAVVGPMETRTLASRCGADVFTEADGSGIDNLLRGVNALDAEGPVLCAASDLPFLQPEHIDAVVERTPAEAELSYLAFSREEWEARFPDSPATFIPLGDGEFTGGCVSIHHAEALRRIEPILQRAFAARKSTLGMARLVGAHVATRMILGRLLGRRFSPCSEDVRLRLESLLGCRCALVRGCPPELAADVDLHEEWRYIQKLTAASEGS